MPADDEPTGAPHTPTLGDDGATGTRTPVFAAPDHKAGASGVPTAADDEVVLVADYPVAPPMRMHDGVWALLIGEVDHCVDDNQVDTVQWCTGSWVAEPTPADGMFDGDLVVRLTAPTTAGDPSSRVDVAMMLAYQGRWQQVGYWPALGNDWPDTVWYTAAAVMGLHIDLQTALCPPAARTHH